MKSRTTAQFRKAFADLPEQIQQTREAYRQFKRDPNPPNLWFKRDQERGTIGGTDTFSCGIRSESIADV